MSDQEFRLLQLKVDKMEAEIQLLEFEVKILRLGIAKLSTQDIDILTAAQDRDSQAVAKAYGSIRETFKVLRKIADYDREPGDYPDEESVDA